MIKTCIVCGNAFEARCNKKTCSPECSKRRESACKAVQAKTRYAANREKIAAQKAARYAANREKAAAYMAAYYAANREKIAARQAAYRAANREKTAASNAAYYAANREKIAARQVAYRARQRAMAREYRRLCGDLPLNINDGESHDHA